MVGEFGNTIVSSGGYEMQHQLPPRATKSQQGNRNRLVLKMRQLNQGMKDSNVMSQRLNTQQSSNTRSLAAINEQG